MRFLIKHFVLPLLLCYYQSSFAQDTATLEFAEVFYDNAWHLIDRQGNAILTRAQPVGAASICMTDNLAISSDGTKVGFIDLYNKQVIPDQFDDTHCFLFGFAAVSKDGKWGIINRAGSFIVPPVYDYAGNFGPEGLAGVIKGNRVGFVDTTGKLVIPPNYYWITPTSSTPEYPIFIHRLITVRDTLDEDNLNYGKAGCLNTKGELVIPIIYDYIDHFSNEGVASAVKDRKLVVIDTLGNIVLEPKGVDHGSLFFEYGLSNFYSRDGYTGLISITGEIIHEPKYIAINRFSEGFAAVKISVNKRSATSAFIDTTGRFVFNKTFGLINDFHEGLAAVQINNRWGFIDTSGKMVIPPIFFGARDFDNGMAIVQVKRGLAFKYGYINREGKFILKPIYDEANPFHYGLAAVKIGKKYGFIDTTGKVVIQPKFEDAFGFQRKTFIK